MHMNIILNKLLYIVGESAWLNISQQDKVQRCATRAEYSISEVRIKYNI